MAILGVGKDEFAGFKKDVLNKIKNLKNDINHKTTDSEENIKNIEKKLIEKRYVINKLSNDIKDFHSKINNSYDKINESESYVTQFVKQAKNNIENIGNINNQSSKIVQEIEEKNSNFIENIENIENNLKISESFPKKVEDIKALLEDIQEKEEDIKDIQSHILNKKTDIDKVYTEILGKDIKREDKTIEHVDGIKDKLEATYNGLSSDINDLKETIEESIQKEQDNFNDLLAQSENKFNEVENKLKTLLPGAMSSGLSSAYKKKIRIEQKLKTRAEKTFGWAIVALIVVALLPVGIDIYRLVVVGDALIPVLKDTSSLMLIVIPLYLPILWIAHSSNKSINLSKRLIEEYTHKSALGETFVGLSNQIESMPDENSSKNQLKTKLLFNLLVASAENPGKLIVDYQKSDHPLMEALEMSSKLSDKIDILDNIPGFSHIANKLRKKKEAIKDKEDKKIEAGSTMNDILEGTPDNETLE